MFKLHKEKKVTTLCSNRVGVARPATSAIQKTTAEPNSKDHDSHIQDRLFWAGGTPEGITICVTKAIKQLQQHLSCFSKNIKNDPKGSANLWYSWFRGSTKRLSGTISRNQNWGVLPLYQNGRRSLSPATRSSGLRALLWYHFRGRPTTSRLLASHGAQGRAPQPGSHYPNERALSVKSRPNKLHGTFLFPPAPKIANKMPKRG